MPRSHHRSALAALLVTGVLLAGCGRAEPVATGSGQADRNPRMTTVAPLPTTTAPAPRAAPSAPAPPVPARTGAPARPATDGRPRVAALTIPGIGVHGLMVVPYRGRTDDAPGTAIQDAGRGASPHGPRGGVGPGGVGNYQVTAHRLSSTGAFELLPRLRRGDEVRVRAGRRLLVYRITATRTTSFRSARSLREQRAPVPGRPGAHPTRAMITLSTCATPEDHARGNYWADRFDNPEHRIDKIGVLVRVAPA